MPSKAKRRLASTMGRRHRETTSHCSKALRIATAMAALGLAFAVIAATLMCRGAMQMISRGHALPFGIQVWVTVFTVIWALCAVANAMRVMRASMGEMSTFDFVMGAASPALIAGGFVSYPLYIAVSPVFATLVAGAIVAGVVSIFKDPMERPLESLGARVMEVGTAAGALLLLAFALYAL